MQRILKLAALAIVLAGLTVLPAFATTVTYTTLASFQGATTGAVTANFDGVAAPLVINNGDTVDGIKFTSSIGGGNQFAVYTDFGTGFSTTSGFNYLGTMDPSTIGSLFGSDSFTMTFSSPITALGLYIINGDPVLAANTFTLDIGVGSVLNSGTADINPLPDGLTQAYFLGITSTTPFSTATLGPTVLGPDGSGPLWNVDDVVMATANGNTPPPPQVPEPGTLVLMATGLGALVRRVRKA